MQLETGGVSKSVTTVLFVLSAVRAVRAVLVSRCIGFTDASGLVEEAPRARL